MKLIPPRNPMMTGKKIKQKKQPADSDGVSLFCLHSFFDCNIIQSVEIKISMIKGESKSWRFVDSEAWIIC